MEFTLATQMSYFEIVEYFGKSLKALEITGAISIPLSKAQKYLPTRETAIYFGIVAFYVYNWKAKKFVN